jgi:hypothetical protein
MGHKNHKRKEKVKGKGQKHQIQGHGNIKQNESNV